MLNRGPHINTNIKPLVYLCKLQLTSISFIYDFFPHYGLIHAQVCQQRLNVIKCCVYFHKLELTVPFCRYGAQQQCACVRMGRKREDVVINQRQ